MPGMDAERFDVFPPGGELHLLACGATFASDLEAREVLSILLCFFDLLHSWLADRHSLEPALGVLDLGSALDELDRLRCPSRRIGNLCQPFGLFQVPLFVRAGEVFFRDHTTPLVLFVPFHWRRRRRRSLQSRAADWVLI
jgi:hypothetical protein